MKKLAASILTKVLIVSGAFGAQEPPKADQKTSKVHDLGDLMSVQGRIERPSLVVVTEEMDSQSLLEKLQSEAWRDLEREALSPAVSAKEPSR